jgi:hypothetical protein
MSLEYRSPVAWRGLPLIHIAFGPRQAGDSARRARGVIAVGYTAQGLLAVGIVALGIVAIFMTCTPSSRSHRSEDAPAAPPEG